MLSNAWFVQCFKVSFMTVSDATQHSKELLSLSEVLGEHDLTFHLRI